MTDRCWWNLDETFIRSVKEGLIELRDKGQAFPDRCETREEWEMFLTGIIEGLTFTTSGSREDLARTKESLHDFVDHIELMWD